jgi:hypothetical protein
MNPPFNLIFPVKEVCDCDLCFVVSLNPFWALHEIIGEA